MRRNAGKFWNWPAHADDLFTPQEWTETNQLQLSWMLDVLCVEDRCKRCHPHSPHPAPAKAKAIATVGRQSFPVGDRSSGAQAAVSA